MKFLAVILSFYFLALNAVPCNDTKDAPSDNVETYVMDIDTEHGQDCELCSPFCNCHCCHVHTINFEVANFEPVVLLSIKENFSHFEGLGKEVAFALFQPPQVCG